MPCNFFSCSCRCRVVRMRPKGKCGKGDRITSKLGATIVGDSQGIHFPEVTLAASRHASFKPPCLLLILLYSFSSLFLPPVRKVRVPHMLSKSPIGKANPTFRSSVLRGQKHQTLCSPGDQDNRVLPSSAPPAGFRL